MKSHKELAKETFLHYLLSLKEQRFTELYKDVLELFEKYKSKYTAEFLLDEFIETDYPSLLKGKLKNLRKKGGFLNYEVINKNKVVRDLKHKIDDKNSMRDEFINICNTHNLAEFPITLDFLPLVVNFQEIKRRRIRAEKKLYKVFNSNYDKIIATLLSPLDEEVKEECFNFFLAIWNRIKKRTKLRAPNLLSPITIFMFFHMKGINLDIKKIGNTIKMTDKQFRQTLNEVIRIYPEYLKRDREKLVHNKLLLFKNKTTLPNTFMTNADAIMEKFWVFLQETTEPVIAGTVAVLAAIGMNIKKPKYSQICEKIKCSQSAVLYQIKNKIFKALNIEGFRDIQHSREMIKDLIIKNVEIKIPEKVSKKSNKLE